MATETLTIPLTNGNVSGTDFISGDKDDTQYVTFTDGGSLSSVMIAKFGKNTPSEPGEGPGGDDEFTFDLSGFDDTFSIGMKSMDAGDTFYFRKATSWSEIATDVWEIHYAGSDGLPHVVTIDLDSANNTGIASIVVTCFTAGTLIDTPKGPRRVEAIGPGMQVTCGDGIARKVVWAASRRVSRDELKNHAEIRPIRISAGALGPGVPESDLLVSPQHRIVIDGYRAQLLFGEDRVLVPAKFLVNDHDIRPEPPGDGATYVHLMFDDHRTILSNGLETESFHPGAVGVAGLTPAARAELFRLLPALRQNVDAFGPACARSLTQAEWRSMVMQ